MPGRRRRAARRFLVHRSSPAMPAPHPSPPVPLAGRVEGAVQPIADLTAADRDAMRALLADQFADVAPEAFDADLNEKDAAVVLRHDGDVVGFSTVLQIDADVDGRLVTAFFSGDTVVRPDARGAMLFPRLLIRRIFETARAQPQRETVWLLLSAGFRTYRALPTLFQRFTPHHAQAAPADRALLAALARERYGDRYDEHAGVVRLAHPTPLRAGAADLPAPRLRDPHVAFFARANPGWIQGDELACLAHMRPDNLTPAGRRLVGPDLAAPFPDAP